MTVPKFPDLVIGPVPRSEMTKIMDLQTDLHLLEMYTFRFECALALFDNAISQSAGPRQLTSADVSRAKMFNEWAAIAARDCTFTVYHFRQTMHKLNDKRKHCRSVSTDGQAMNNAIQMFSRFFPQTQKNRDAVGHEADTLQTRKRNSAKGPIDLASLGIGQGQIENVMISGALIGRKITNTIEQEMVQLELSQDNLDRLRQIQAIIYRAFEQHNPPIDRPPG